MNTDKVALFDLDGSLADFDHALRRDLRAVASPNEPEITETTNLHHLEEEYTYIRARMDFIKSKPGWWRTLRRIESGFTIVREARRIGYHIDVLTKAPRKHAAAWMEKVEWCHAQPELAEADIHLTMNKGLVYGALLFDDFPVYMEKWLQHRPRGLGIMPVTLHNMQYTHPQVIKYDGGNLEEVVAAMEQAFIRKPKAPLTL